jgi:hypothetical protein
MGTELARTPLQLSAAARNVIASAHTDGVSIDDGNVVDLLADNLNIDPDQAREIIRQDYKLAEAFARAARGPRK